MHIQPMSAEHARTMLAWRYEAPYDQYDIVAQDLEEEIAYLCDPDHHYYAILDDKQGLIGHCVFHEEGRVPGGDYSEEALDVGIGMRPDWTGKGAGTEISGQVFQFGSARYGIGHLRVTIAAWNDRAQKVCINHGFAEVQRFMKSGTDREFLILTRTG